MSLKVQILKAQKILVGSVGVATVSFLSACGTGVANLMAPPSCEVAPNNSYCIGQRPDAGNDAAMDKGADQHDAPAETASDTAPDMLDDAGDALVDATDATAG